MDDEQIGTGDWVEDERGQRWQVMFIVDGEATLETAASQRGEGDCIIDVALGTLADEYRKV
jgi:hypothetical protein